MKPRRKSPVSVSIVIVALLAMGIIFAGQRTRAQQGTARAGSSAASWDALVDQFFDEGYYKLSPIHATRDGFHKYDTLMDDVTSAGIAHEVGVLRDYERRFAAVDPKTLDAVAAGDREIILSNIRSRLLTLETIRPWEKDPDYYSSGVTIAVYVIMERRYAPADTRLDAVIAREKQIPAALETARKNLENPPRIYTEIALQQLPGLISLFHDALPAAFADASATKKAEFAKTNEAAMAAMKSYEDWMKKDLLPRSKGDFRIGADAYSKKLRYDEMVDIPLDHLLEVGLADLHKNQAEFKRVAAIAAPGKTAHEALEELEKDHPRPDQLLRSFTDTFAGLTGFIRDKHIATIPNGPQPKVQETPPFERATTTASMDYPGPLETASKDSYFNVTLPGPNDTAKQIEERMEDFNRGTIISTAVHEAYPGHYLQYLFTPQAPSKTRRIIWNRSAGEGWAHYTEQMMLDEGYGQPGAGAKDAHEAALIRLGQLQDALLRDARFVVGIEMHTGKMAYDQGVDFFEKEGYQTHEIGVEETKRGTSDPTYLYYTLGKLEIMKLREDVRRKEGPAFSLQKFHDAYLRQGFTPIKLIRQAMLGDNSPAL